MDKTYIASDWLARATALIVEEPPMLHVIEVAAAGAPGATIVHFD